jgi:sulfur carrier protein ThiS
VSFALRRFQGEAHFINDPPMRITVRFSGLFRILAGTDQEALDVAEGTRVQGLVALLGQRHQGLPVDSPKTYVIVNDRVAPRDHILSEGDHLQIYQLLGGG